MSRSCVRVIDGPVNGGGPKPGDERLARRAVRAQPSRWAGSTGPGVVPSLEFSGGVGEGRESADRVEQVLVVSGCAVEVFPRQLEPQIPGECACPVIESIE